VVQISDLFQFCIGPALAFPYIPQNRSWLGIITSRSRQPGTFFFFFWVLLKPWKNIKIWIMQLLAALIGSFSAWPYFISLFPVIEGLLGKEGFALLHC